jgi:2-C-methyl-D-erythritol 4-phosphate cytidylyltransferase
MNSDLPKQFLLLGDLPVIMHSINAFKGYDPSIRVIVVLPAVHMAGWESLCRFHNFTTGHMVVEGGETRTQSVKNALRKTPDEGFVAVHDAVRPLVSEEIISTAFEEAQIYGNAIPAIAVNETVRKIDSSDTVPVERDSLRIIQTPQVFRTDLLKKAYSLFDREEFTDDATVVEKSGGTIHLTAGSRDNIKITYPSDLRIAESLLRVRHPRS